MIRKFKKGDELAVARLEKECFSSPWSENALLESAEEGIIFLIFEECKEIKGYVGLSHTLDEGYITNIAVFGKYRRQGIGRQLLSALDDIAEELSLSFISLEVRESNSAAIKLYEALGYKNEGLRKGFYENPKENAIIMTKRR